MKDFLVLLMQFFTIFVALIATGLTVYSGGSWFLSSFYACLSFFWVRQTMVTLDCMRRCWELENKIVEWDKLIGAWQEFHEAQQKFIQLVENGTSADVGEYAAIMKEFSNSLRNI